MSDPSSRRPPQAHKGRGALSNPQSRFESLSVSWDEGEERPPPRTQWLRDHSRSIISRNDSDDIPFNASINPYRGCEHGCIYCYARPTHEYLGFSAGQDFETKILVKDNAATLLRKTLLSPRWQPKAIAFSGVTDAYQPAERKLGITRACLEVLAEFRNPVSILTKNALITRDIDLLQDLAAHQAASTMFSLTTLDADLVQDMEPRTSRPQRRLKAIETLAQRGIPVGVIMGPIIPGLTDHEIPTLLQAAVDHGAQYATYTILRLPLGTGELFSTWLEAHQPGRKDKILRRIREMRGGELDRPGVGRRMRTEGAFAAHIRTLFDVSRRKYGLGSRGPVLSTAAFRRPKAQLSLFDDFG